MSVKELAPAKEFSQTRLTRLLIATNAVIRHDVDYDPICALKMAKKEASLGVHSTYYIRLLDEYLHPNRARTIFNEIFNLGHDLGSHVDLCLPRKAVVPDDYLRVCCERDYLELSLSLPVGRRVSLHAPPRASVWRDIAGFEHAMSPDWCGRYVSDSRGVFRRSPEQALENASLDRPVQLGLHCEWWFWPEEKCDEWRAIEALKP